VQRRNGDLFFSPSDLHDFLECEHLTALELRVARGELVRAAVDNPQAELVRRKGEGHEAAHLAVLEADGLEVARIDFDGDWAAAARATEEAMRAGVEVVCQAVLVSPDGWRGVERQPDGSYEVADTKLARSASPHFLLQLAFSSEQVGRIQGRLPERMRRTIASRSRRLLHRVLPAQARAVSRVRRIRARRAAAVSSRREGSATRAGTPQ